MTATSFPLLISQQEFDRLSHQYAGELQLVEASWFMPKDQRNARKEYEEIGHIPGAVFFDIEDISDPQSPFPHTLPKAEYFAEKVGKLGIRLNSKLVIYDRHPLGLFSAARAWWMFKIFGHQDVALLNGGLVQWMEAKRPLEKGIPSLEPTHYAAHLDIKLLRTREQMLENCQTREEQVLDARSAARFQGLEPEPRPGLKSGHIPGSLNLPFAKLLHKDGSFLSREELLTLFKDHKLTLDAPIITSCGSGITAAILLFGLYYCGAKELSLYDGSSTEWLDPRYDHPVEK